MDVVLSYFADFEQVFVDVIIFDLFTFFQNVILMHNLVKSQEILESLEEHMRYRFSALVGKLLDDLDRLLKNSPVGECRDTFIL